MEGDEAATEADEQGDRPVAAPATVARPVPRWRWLSYRRQREGQRQTLVAEARTPIVEPVRVVVAAPKGGVGKTTVALGVAETLAGLRADRVAVLDAQPLGGTAGLRVDGQRGQGLPVLLTELDQMAEASTVTAWSRFATIEHRTRVTVFGRVEPAEGSELEIPSYHRVVEGLARFWPLVVVDTGAPEGRSVLQQAVVASADVLVVVCGPGDGTVRATAGWLRECPVPPSRRVGVVVPITGGDPDIATALMRSTCGRTANVPADPALGADAPVPLLGTAKPRTRDAFTQLAASVMAASQSARNKE